MSFNRVVFAEPVKRLFIVHSYEKNHICGQPQHDGALKGLEDAGWVIGKNLDVSVYYMDTKRKNNTAKLMNQQAVEALSKIKTFQPDVILILDDNAFRTVALPLSGTSVDIVFSGMNGHPEDYNESARFMKNRRNPGGNITGIYEKLYIREAIQVLSTMHDIKKILFLDDISPTGRAIAKQVEMELDPDRLQEPLPCTIDHRTLTSWETFQQTIEEINSNSDIGAFYLGTLLLKNASGHTYTAREIIDYTITYSKKPAIAPNYAFIKLGLYGGASVDFFAMGRQAGQKVAAILSGDSAGNLPIEDAKRLALVFNLKRAETLGLKIPNDILMAADEVFRR